MERYDDICLLLDDSKDKIKLIEAEYQKLKEQSEQDPKLVLTIKHCLMNLRSCLEYAAQDIWRSYNKTPKKRLYFPYGKDSSDFANSLKSNLPSLDSCKPNVVRLIRSLQPFECSNTWLTDLCAQVNLQKHDRLTKLKKIVSDGKAVILEAPNTDQKQVMIISGDSSVTFDGCTFNGVPMGKSGSLTISTSDTKEQIGDKISPAISWTQTYDWVKITADDGNVDIITHLKHCESQISSFIQELKKHL